MKTLKQHLNEVSKNKSGACWMQDFEPQIIKAVKEWLTQKRQEQSKKVEDYERQKQPYKTEEFCHHLDLIEELLEELQEE